MKNFAAKKRKKNTFFDYFNILLMLVIMIVTIYPFWNQLMISMATTEDIYNTKLMLFPSAFNWTSYQIILDYDLLWNGYLNTIIRTILGTAFSLILTVLTAYPLSKKELPFNRLFTIYVLIPMFFNGGLIPNFVLIRNLHFIDTIFALIIPGAISTFNVLIIRNFVNTIPKEIEEAATIDGASHLRILFKIMLPLMVPVIATVGLWIGVGHWQAWYDNLLYISTPEKWGFMMLTRKLVIENTTVGSLNTVAQNTASFYDQRQLRAAIIVISIVPMLLVYPFLQRYFTKGIVLGAVK